MRAEAAFTAGLLNMRRPEVYFLRCTTESGSWPKAHNRAKFHASPVEEPNRIRLR
jgi:hypothetical protein